MSNDKQNQQDKFFNLPVPILVAVLTVIGGIATAIITSYDKILFLKNSPNSPVFGEFIVQANKPGGKDFTNADNSLKKYRFVASGKWTYNKTLDLHSAAGHPSYPKASKNYYLPSNPEGSLIVRRENGSYELVGQERTFTLKPKETVFFTINDTNDSNSGETYSDNEGSVTVEWQLQK